MSESPLVSVVVPTYDRPEMLSRAIESVIDQTYRPIELIVVDDCSPESPQDLVLKIVPSDIQVSFYRHDKNHGHAVARNTGMENADGEFIAFLDDDDVWAEEKIEKQVERFQEASEHVGVVYTGIKQLNEDGSVNAVTTPTHSGDVTRQLLINDFIGTGSMYMIRSEAYKSVGGFDERFPAWVDWDYSLRLSIEYEFVAVTEPLVSRYVGGHDQSSDDYKARKNTASQLFIKKYRPVAVGYGYIMKRRMIATVEFYLAQSAFSNELYGTARRHTTNALFQYPLDFTFLVFFVILSGGKYTFKPAQAAKRWVVRLTH